MRKRRKTMAREHPDLVGQKFGKLEVVEFSHINRAAYWKCRCECGKERVVRTGELRSGVTTNCGCTRKRKHGRAPNNRYDPTYRSWYDMIRRCYNPKCESYKDYGAKGVQVTQRWLGKGGFARFLVDMGERPAGLTLDRRNPYGHYCKSNCRWASRKVQQSNKRANWVGVRRIG